jgi:carbamoyl-phosphate synthase large subunit
VLPAVDLSEDVLQTIREYTRKLAVALNVRGLVNIQFAIQRGRVFVIEVNPRASRTVPYVSKATGIPLAKVASRIMVGRKLKELLPEQVASGKDLETGSHFYVKSPVFPWGKFPGVDTVLGPEMKSTGEVMGIDRDFGSAFAKSQTAAYGSLPAEGTVFVSVANRDKRALVFPVKRLADLGFRVLATEGTAEMLRRNGIPCDVVRKHFEEPSPDRPAQSAVDAIRAGEVQMVINTPYGNSGPRIDGYEIRSAAVAMNIPCVTTVQGASAAVQGIESGIRGDIDVMSLQELHSTLNNGGH